MTQPTLQQLRERYRQRRQDVIDSYRKHVRPEKLLGGLRRVTDQTLREILKTNPLPQGACLAAVGGYGRGELFPWSDIDLLILLAREPDTNDQTLLEALVTAL